MSILEQKTFLTSIHPFERLNKVELENIASNIDIVYFKKDEIIQKTSQEPTHLYFVLKGLVQEKNDEEVLSIFTKNEIFDPVSLIENYSKHTFVTSEETICYALPREIFIKVLHKNEEMESYFFQTISQKLNNNIHNEKNKEMANIMIAKVKDAKIHKAVLIDTNKPIFEAVKVIKKEKVPTLLL
ncbi:Crp/Fnr family transcriptional regulator [Poseidonibacter sp.]|uniref:Crp/Fnr family transcriptional regulator n=1 Tax=Poseidonibacter sp. TaxID=2321188 RepID=UPI003C7840E6